MELNEDNYYSVEASNEFFSKSLYHSFVGTETYPGCEAKTIAMLDGKWETKPSTAMLVGSYVDEYFSGGLEKFKEKNPQILTSKGELRADFMKAEEIITFIKKDALFMEYISGESQVLVTGEIGGVKWKGKIDSLHRGLAIVDLKVVASIRDKVWNPFTRQKVNFIEASGYVEQGAVYRELYYQMTGEKLPFFIAAVSKEEYPDKEIINVPDTTMDMALKAIEQKVKYLKPIWERKFAPVPCGVCNYCKSVKVLNNTISMIDL